MAELQAHTKGLNDQLSKLNRDKAALETNVSSQGQEKDQLIKLISDQQEQLRENKEQLKQTKSELDKLREELEKERKARVREKEEKERKTVQQFFSL
jgi:septal ring factor EnvC (AmiA/AmiB activator)